MATMNISLPESLKDWVEQQAKRSHYSSTSDYLGDLVRRDKERAEKIANLQAAVDKGLASGIGTRTTDELREAARAQVKSSES